MDEIERTVFIGLPKEIPPSFSWRELMSSVRDQGQIAACVAFAATAIMEFYKRKRSESEEEYDLSEALLYEISTYEDYQTSLSCRVAGRYPSDVFRALEEFGVPREDCHPYDKVCLSPPRKWGESSTQWCFRWEELSNLNKLWNTAAIDTLDVAAMKNAIYVAPLFTCMIVFDDFTKFFYKTENDVYYHPPSPSGEECEGFHAVVLTGYDDEKGAFELRNSWGTAWGCGGYAWMSYDLVTAGEYTVIYNGGEYRLPFFYDAYHLYPPKYEWKRLRTQSASIPAH